MASSANNGAASGSGAASDSEVGGPTSRPANAGNSFHAESVGNSGYLARHNSQMVEEGRSFSGNERNKVWFNRAGEGYEDFSDLSGADSPNDGRAVLATDFDDDGDVDLFVHYLQRERHVLYRNDLGIAGGFVKVRLRATRSQHEAIGATVILAAADRKTAQTLSRGAGFVSCQAPELVFGLGGATRAELSVRWPSGELEAFGVVDANSRVRLVEGAGKPERIEPRPVRLPDPLPRGFRVTVGGRIPPLAVLDPSGAEVVLDPAKLGGGKRLYLNLWASYCASCVREIPDLQELHAGGDTRVVALSMDAPADLHEAHDLFERRGARFPAFYLGAGKVGEGRAAVSEIVDIERLPIPSTIVLGADGIIERIITGPIRLATSD